jgi:uncharacterized membrane protein YdjX (TVP38/TMEM64 family)
MKRFWLLTGAMMLLFLVLFGIAEWLHVPILTDPGPLLAKTGWIAAAGGVLLLIADVLLPVPASLVMILHGALFGVVGGTLLSMAGALGAAAFGFWIGRRGGPLYERLVPEDERRRADALLQEWGDLAIIVTRPVPILAETMAILAGASPMSWGRMLLSTFAGSLPAALLYALTGATARNLDNAALVFGLVLLVAGLFWAVGRYFFRSAKSPAAPRPPASSPEAPPRPPGPGDESPSRR